LLIFLYTFGRSCQAILPILDKNVPEETELRCFFAKPD
jgi:hypothetical protein